MGWKLKKPFGNYFIPKKTPSPAAPPTITAHPKDNYGLIPFEDTAPKSEDVEPTGPIAIEGRRRKRLQALRAGMLTTIRTNAGGAEDTPFLLKPFLNAGSGASLLGG